MKNLTYLYDFDYISTNREYRDDYSPICDSASYDDSFKDYSDFDESRFSLDCLMIA